MHDIPCGYLEIDESRLIVELNSEGQRLLGRPREAFVGTKLSDLLPTGTRVLFHTHLYPELALRGRVDELYVSLRTASVELPVLLNAIRRDAPEGPRFGFAFLPIRRRALFERELVSTKQAAEVAVLAQRQALAEVMSMRAQLTMAERLAALGTLAAGVAHEISNPLTYVIGSLESLVETLTEADSTEVRERTLEFASDAIEGSRRVQNIVRDLKLLSRQQGPPKHRVELDQVVASALRLTKHALRSCARVQLETRHPNLVVHADEGRLVQVLVNLLVNAAQAMVEPDPSRNHIVVAIDVDTSGRAVLEVADNGAGIPAAIRDKIFDPFFTTKPVGAGTGLGLAICQGIVADLGGTIELATEVGKGTRFRILLPRLTGAAANSG